VNDKTYEDAGSITRKRESHWLDYIERRHQHIYTNLYWRPHHKSEPTTPENSIVAAVDRMNAEHDRWRRIVACNGCCDAYQHEVLVIDRWTDADGTEHERERMAKRDGWCPNYKGICPRIGEAARAVRFCESLMEYLDLLNIEVQPEEACQLR
jgi:hypothetical protein